MDIRRRVDVSNKSSKYFTVENVGVDIKISFDEDESGCYSGSLYYSYDEETWYDFENETIIRSGETVYLKGNIRTLEEPSFGDGFALWQADRWEDDELVKYNFSGNLMSIIYMDDADKYDSLLDDYQFGMLFYGCDGLEHVSEDFLPAKNLTIGCYEHMFDSCYFLKSAPNLPAKNLTEGCYEHMFDQCESLEYGPALLATNLARYCYRAMFERCEQLKGIKSNLPALHIAWGSYQDMFMSCYNLENGIEMLAQTSDTRGCERMYSYCEKLIYCPDILIQLNPDSEGDDVGNYAFNKMFEYCKSLTKSPTIHSHLSAATDAFNYMFQGCTSLKEIRIMTSDLYILKVGSYTVGATVGWLTGITMWDGGKIYKHVNAELPEGSANGTLFWEVINEYNQ